MLDVVQKARDWLRHRRLAYRRVFNLESRDVEIVLADLARFCRAHASTFTPDPRAHALAEGRREVFLRIAEHMQLNEEDLWKLYGGPRDAL
jgi:sugar/nucleoside kinase (ribokinase family)